MKRADRIRLHDQIVKAIRSADLNKIKEIDASGYQFNEDVDALNPAVDDNTLIYIAVTERQKTDNREKRLDILRYLLEEGGLDPAVENNLALKTAYKMKDIDAAYELIQHPFVREDLFLDCKDSLNLQEAKFLLFVPYPIEDADELYNNFIGDDDDDSFIGYSDDEEDSFDEYSDEDDEEDEFVDSDDTESKEGLQKVRELLIDVKKERKKKMEKELPYKNLYGPFDLYDIGKKLERGEITKDCAQKIIKDEWMKGLAYKGELFQDMEFPYEGASDRALEERGMTQPGDFIWYYDVKNDELETLPGNDYMLSDVPRDNTFRGEYYLVVYYN